MCRFLISRGEAVQTMCAGGLRGSHNGKLDSASTRCDGEQAAGG